MCLSTCLTQASLVLRMDRTEACVCVCGGGSEVEGEDQRVHTRYVRIGLCVFPFVCLGLCDLCDLCVCVCVAVLSLRPPWQAP